MIAGLTKMALMLTVGLALGKVSESKGFQVVDYPQEMQDSFYDINRGPKKVRRAEVGLAF